MKTELILFKFITFLLLPLAALFGISFIAGLLSVLINPSALLGVVMVGGVVGYIITSFVFIVKCIDGGKPYRAALVKWIRITAIISFLFCALMILGYLVITSNSSVTAQLVDQLVQQGNLPANIGAIELTEAFRELFTIFMVIGLVLILHIIMGFRIIPRYKNRQPDERLDIEQQQ